MLEYIAPFFWLIGTTGTIVGTTILLCRELKWSPVNVTIHVTVNERPDE